MNFRLALFHRLSLAAAAALKKKKKRTPAFSVRPFISETAE